VTGIRVLQRGEALEIRALAPRASLDGLKLSALELEFWVAEGPGDFEKTARRTRRVAEPGATVIESRPLPPAATTVRVAVQAWSGSRRSPRSPATVLKIAPAPVAPSQLAAALTPEGVVLTWEGPVPSPPPTPSPAPGAAPSTPSSDTTRPPQATRAGFAIYRGPDGAAERTSLTPTPLADHRHLDAAAPQGQRVCYEVRAWTAGEPPVESAPAPEACLDIKDVAPPAAPAGLSILAREGGLELAWKASPESDLAAYRVLRAAGAAAAVTVAELPSGQTLWLDAAASPGVAYRYRLVAVDASGNASEPSPPVEATRP
jgi:hypothetical protein